jgi:hypothetical protein
MCKRDIIVNENVFELPSHLVISSFDPYESKDDILNLLLKAEEEHPILKKDPSWKSKSLLVLKYMIEYHYHREDPFSTLKKHGEDSRYFHQVYIEFLARLSFDDLPHWTDEQVEFYAKRSFTL